MCRPSPNAARPSSRRPAGPADSDVRSAAEAVVRPITEFAQGGWRQRAYLQIGSELSRTVERQSAGVRELMAQTAGQAAWKVLRSRCAGVPADLWRQRQQICIVFIGRAAADRARLLDGPDRRATSSPTTGSSTIWSTWSSGR